MAILSSGSGAPESKAMPLADKVFFVVSGAFFVVFGTGLWLIFVEHNLSMGIPLTGLGVIGMGASLLEKPKEAAPDIGRQRNYAILNAVLAICILITVGYDMYDRHSNTSSHPLTADTLRTLTRWDDYQYLEIPDRHFKHETVKLDGRKFINCTFDTVTFEYEGTAPFLFDPWPPKITGGVRTRSSVNPIKNAFNVCLLGAMRGPPISVENAPTIP